MDFGRITIDRELVLYLFGTPGQERFDFMWEILGEGMLGYILLLDVNRPDSLGEAVGILDAFRRMARVPFVVALNRTTGVDEVEEARIRQTLGVDGSVPLVPCDATDKESVKAVLLALLYSVLDEVEPAKAGVRRREQTCVGSRAARRKPPPGVGMPQGSRRLRSPSSSARSCPTRSPSSRRHPRRPPNGRLNRCPARCRCSPPGAGCTSDSPTGPSTSSLLATPGSVPSGQWRGRWSGYEPARAARALKTAPQWPI
jgi:hypothetical protein